MLHDQIDPARGKRTLRAPTVTASNNESRHMYLVPASQPASQKEGRKEPPGPIPYLPTYLPSHPPQADVRVQQAGAVALLFSAKLTASPAKKKKPKKTKKNQTSAPLAVERYPQRNAPQRKRKAPGVIERSEKEGNRESCMRRRGKRDPAPWGRVGGR